MKDRVGTEPLTASPEPDRLVPLRVCLVTTEFHGLFKNGGIGTANTGLALALAQAGFQVTVAFANSDQEGPRAAAGTFAEIQAGYGGAGITLDFIPVSPLIPNSFDDARSASYCVYLYLKQHEFDVVYFNDCGGQGYYSLLSKHLGAFPKVPRMYVVAHGPQEWVMELNSLAYKDRWPVIVSFMERRCAELADALISPSQYLVDWMTSHGWRLATEVKVIPNIATLPGSIAANCDVEPRPVAEIVFFGRLEVRKGLELFCDAIDRLEPATFTKVRITFMGKFSRVSSLHSGIYVIERARTWPCSLRLLSTWGQEEALAYLSKPGLLAVVPSLAENSPCVVAECLDLRLPFIATDGGGTPELVHPEDRNSCLVASDPLKLAAKLNHIVEHGQKPCRPANSRADIRSQWLQVTSAGHTNGVPDDIPQSSAPFVTSRPDDLPVVTVCLAPSAEGPGMDALIESLRRQTYPNLEILALEQSQFLALPDSLRLVSGVFSDRSDGRNALAAEAKGEFLLFVEEDRVTLTPECIQVLIRAAMRAQADIVTGLALEAVGARHENPLLKYFPLGACAELGAFENCFGKGLLLVRRQSFERLGGFELPCDPAIQDWLFLSTSVLSGLRLEVVPEPVFRYGRVRSAQLSRGREIDGYRRILAGYAKLSIQVINHIVEGLLDIDDASEIRLRLALGEPGGRAWDIAHHVSTKLDPNHSDALRGVVQFFIERHRIEDAFDFAFHNGRSLLADAIGSATQVTEEIALNSVGRYAVQVSQDVPLNDELRLLAESVSSLPAKESVQPDEGVAQTVQAGMSILKAAAICPAGTKRIKAVAAIEAPIPGSVSLALVACSKETRLHIAKTEITSAGAFWWSGWVAPSENGENISLTVQSPGPASELLDLYFICRTDEDDCSDGRVVWTSVTASISVNDTFSRITIEPVEKATPVSRDVLDGGILLTQHDEFSFPVFVPGNPTLLHPLPGRTVLVRLARAVPPGATGIRSVVSVDHAEAHPVQFAVWIRPSSTPALQEADFTGSDAFSGWFPVADKFRHHRFTVRLAETADEPMDVYLATKVVDFPDTYFCHAVWHDLLILE